MIVDMKDFVWPRHWSLRWWTCPCGGCLLLEVKQQYATMGNREGLELAHTLCRDLFAELRWLVAPSFRDPSPPQTFFALEYRHSTLLTADGSRHKMNEEANFFWLDDMQGRTEDDIGLATDMPSQMSRRPKNSSSKLPCVVAEWQCNGKIDVFLNHRP